MPQDILRSAVYRSFVTCDDPKGVVECGTIRKSKNNPKKLEDEVKIRRTAKNSNSSASRCKEEGKVMGSHNPSSFQLMEVSREAQKLTNVIDTWSTGHSKDIAKDLLKGALDLQESLVMLGKLQEASQYMAKLRKKQKKKSRGDTFDEHVFQRTNSDCCRDDGYEVGFQKQRVSVDGASRDCFDELRTVIRDSLARQNLLPPGSDDEKAFFRDKGTVDSTTDIASTSSSQSSMFLSKSPLKTKGSNLIAKLMGLEAIPSKIVSNAPRKQLGRDKFSGDSRPVFEVDMPMKMKNPQSVANKVDIEKRKLDNIVENMKFKGVLSSNFGEGFQFQPHHSTASYCRYSEYDPPVVVIKPIRFSSSKAVEPHPQMFCKDVKTGKHHQQAMYQRDSSSELTRRLKINETRSEKPSHKGYRNRNAVREKPEDMVVKTNGKISSVPVNQQQRKKTVDEQKVGVIPKAKPMRKKQGEAENLKSEHVPRPQHQSKSNGPEERKMKMAGSKITKNRTSIQKNTSSNLMSEEAEASAVTRNTGDRRKKLNNDKLVKEGLPDEVVVVNSSPNFIDKTSDAIDPSGENESDVAQTSTRTTDELLTEEGTVGSDFRIKDQTNYCQNCSCNVPPQTQQTTCIIGGAKDCISHGCYMTDKIKARTRTEEKDFLSGNPSFISHVEMLFEVSTNQAIVPQASIIYDIKKADLSLLFDCANELVLQKHLRFAQTKHPLLPNTLRRTNISISLNHLVEEVCYEIEKLKRYSENAGEKLHMDGVYAVLERDLRSVAGPSGTWDLGWSHNFTADEVEQVVGEIEKLVFSELVEEIVTDDVL